MQLFRTGRGKLDAWRLDYETSLFTIRYMYLLVQVGASSSSMSDGPADAAPELHSSML